MTWKHYVGTSLFLIGVFITMYGAFTGLAQKWEAETIYAYGILGIIIFSSGLILLFIEKYSSDKS